MLIAATTSDHLPKPASTELALNSAEKDVVIIETSLIKHLLLKVFLL